MKKINYISEINLPSNSGYAHHVLKICDAFSNFKETKLFVLSQTVKFQSLKSNYLLKKKFQIQKFSTKKKFNFFDRVSYAFHIKKNIEDQSIIISRSLISSMLLSIFNKKNIVELHHPPTGLTNLIFNIYRFFGLDKNLDYIFLHKNLKKELKITKGLVLDDAVDYDDFRKIKKKNVRKFCYVGSLFRGKGIETIIKLAKKFPNEKFHVYGDKKTLENSMFENKNIFRRNILFYDFKSYRNIPEILKSSKFLLLPYSNQVLVNSDSLEVSNYMSPLKMFDYLAAGRIILASNLNVYSHILKNNYNCFLTEKNEEKYWKELIQKALNRSNFKSLEKNATLTAKKYSWNNRVKKILQYIDEL
mgnify:CR=1 FL=1|tara:strand:+ start:2045 stop:3124 length:1080 start_codon:yes stop_codon:yes gene_type:complete